MGGWRGRWLPICLGPANGTQVNHETGDPPPSMSSSQARGQSEWRQAGSVLGARTWPDEVSEDGDGNEEERERVREGVGDGQKVAHGEQMGLSGVR